MTSDRIAGERRFSRRKLLSGISALTLPSLIPHGAFGQAQGGPLAISAADSLASCMSLWSAVESATYRGVALESEGKYEDCTTSLEDLKDALKQLKSRLEHVPHKANWHMIENHLDSPLQRGLVLTSSGDRGDQYVRVTNFLPSTTAALASLIAEISADCSDLVCRISIEAAASRLDDAGNYPRIGEYEDASWSWTTQSNMSST